MDGATAVAETHVSLTVLIGERAGRHSGLARDPVRRGTETTRRAATRPARPAAYGAGLYRPETTADPFREGDPKQIVLDPGGPGRARRGPPAAHVYTRPETQTQKRAGRPPQAPTHIVLRPWTAERVGTPRPVPGPLSQSENAGPRSRRRGEPCDRLLLDRPRPTPSPGPDAAGEAADASADSRASGPRAPAAHRPPRAGARTGVREQPPQTSKEDK
jgi:hypothetical protein